MARPKTIYACTECGHSSPKWLGRCPGCGAWSTLIEEVQAPAVPGTRSTGRQAAAPVRLGEVRAEGARRLPTGIDELDRALGGGVVSGGVVLLGGDPGIGKSTLLMQALAALAHDGHDTLYVTGEESAAQVGLRARRLGLPGVESVHVLATTELEPVERALDPLRPAVLVVDSIQTLRCAGLDSAPGSISQLREVTSRLTDVAKREGVGLFLIGHVTKEGALAGPKVLEHLVDTVLSFEGDASHAFRLVRATKNRFGPTNEVGVFEMAQEGLREVADPSRLLLSERPHGAPGSVVLPTAEGSRPLLVEVQSLVAPAAYGAARRVASGIDASRLGILLAVLDRKADIHVLDRDVFASVAGGMRVDERALDLAVAVAVVSSLRDRAPGRQLAVFGEVGLAGEVRGVPRPVARVAEARKMGLTRIVLPRGNMDSLGFEDRVGLELVPVSRLDEALEAAF
ncbi:MAG: DNA repair protein RadA [Myxococcota bacterium]